MSDDHEAIQSMQKHKIIEIFGCRFLIPTDMNI